MKILLLNGRNEQHGKLLQSYLEQLSTELKKHQHDVTHIRVMDKKIKNCTGCWGCWTKTPGRCFVSDDSDEIRREVMHSDVVLFASPIIMGFTSAVLKRLQDKLIPLLLPYIDIVHKENHHQKRYASYPKIGLLLEKANDSDDEDIEIIRDIYERLALNFRSALILTTTTENKIEDSVNAINHI